MREIKFRAWVEEPGTDKRWFFYFKIGETVSPSLSVVAWEQFTGLVDRNGREIYEGDIVVTDYGTGPVEYSGVGFSVDCDSISEYWETSQSIEVIGNIHENPELLND